MKPGLQFALRTGFDGRFAYFVDLGRGVLHGCWANAEEKLVVNLMGLSLHSPQTVWGIVFTLCRQLSAASPNGTFTRRQLQEAILKYEWLTCPTNVQYPKKAKRDGASAEELLAFLGWATELTHEVELERFSCAKAA